MNEGAPEDINFHEVALERAGLRKLKRETPETFSLDVQTALDEVNEQAKKFPKEKISKGKERLKADKKNERR